MWLENDWDKRSKSDDFLIFPYFFSFDHWSLRLQAAELVAFTAKTYGNTYTTLLPRVTKTLAKALSYDPAINEIKPFSTHFGAIVALTLLGTNVIDSVLMPMLENYLNFMADEGNAEILGSEEEKGKVLAALENAINQWKEQHDSTSYNSIINKHF